MFTRIRTWSAQLLRFGTSSNSIRIYAWFASRVHALLRASRETLGCRGYRRFRILIGTAATRDHLRLQRAAIFRIRLQHPRPAAVCTKAPHRTAPYCTATHCTAPHDKGPHCTASHCTEPHRTAPRPGRGCPWHPSSAGRSRRICPSPRTAGTRTIAAASRTPASQASREGTLPGDLSAGQEPNESTRRREFHSMWVAASMSIRQPLCSFKTALMERGTGAIQLLTTAFRQDCFRRRARG